jgi:hypothetical protein
VTVTSDLIVGPAVVVDDKVHQAEGVLQQILAQLSAAGLPVVQLAQLPTIDSLVHWRQLALIVLDWELSYSAAEDADLPTGIAVPAILQGEAQEEVHDFIRALMVQTTAPVFILSNASVDEIREALDQNLGDIKEALDRRLQVYSKSEVQIDLMDKLYHWISSKPSLVALKAWNREYVRAETAMFQDFDEASGDWVAAVHAAASADGIAPEIELREILSRNIVNRVGKVEFFPAFAQLEGSAPDGPGLRRVLNRGAVIPGHSLEDQGLGTGDLFVSETASSPYGEIRVVVTPDCELVRAEELRITFLTAVRSVKSGLSKNRIKQVLKGSDGHIWSCLLTPDGDEYDIKLSGWDMVRITPTEQGLWSEHKRIGRLMEPYLSHLQQNFALNVTRKGLPRLPDDFFD